MRLPQLPRGQPLQLLGQLHPRERSIILVVVIVVVIRFKKVNMLIIVSMIFSTIIITTTISSIMCLCVVHLVYVCYVWLFVLMYSFKRGILKRGPDST